VKTVRIGTRRDTWYCGAARLRRADVGICPDLRDGRLRRLSACHPRLDRRSRGLPPDMPSLLPLAFSNWIILRNIQRTFPEPSATKNHRPRAIPMARAVLNTGGPWSTEPRGRMLGVLSGPRRPGRLVPPHKHYCILRAGRNFRESGICRAFIGDSAEAGTLSFSLGVGEGRRCHQYDKKQFPRLPALTFAG
jgi:hypothetical protein